VCGRSVGRILASEHTAGQRSPGEDAEWQSKESRAGVGPMSPASGGEGGSSDREVLLSGHRGAPGAARRTSSEPTPRGVRLAGYPGDASNIKVVPTAHFTNASGMARAIAWTRSEERRVGNEC